MTSRLTLLAFALVLVAATFANAMPYTNMDMRGATPVMTMQVMPAGMMIMDSKQSYLNAMRHNNFKNPTMMVTRIGDADSLRMIRMQRMGMTPAMIPTKRMIRMNPMMMGNMQMMMRPIMMNQMGMMHPGMMNQMGMMRPVMMDNMGIMQPMQMHRMNMMQQPMMMNMQMVNQRPMMMHSMHMMNQPPMMMHDMKNMHKMRMMQQPGMMNTNMHMMDPRMGNPAMMQQYEHNKMMRPANYPTPPAGTPHPMPLPDIYKMQMMNQMYEQ